MNNNVDFITRYNDREIRRAIMKALGEMKPDVLRQVVNTDTYFSGPDFKNLVNELIEHYCRRFVQHLAKWRPRVGHSNDYLTAMINYHAKWEGFRCSEPWADCEGRKISFFFDVNYNRRVREMDEFFVVEH